MYFFSVAALFRNEEHSIVEWVEHYIFHGANHIYLIDDDSTDNSCKLLEPYIEKKLVTVFNAKWTRYLGRQRDMYNHYILPLLHTTQWLLLLDMDEYLWSPQNIDLKKTLAHCWKTGQVQIDHTLFGSSGHEIQPKSIVGSFIRRSAQSPTLEPGNRKYFVQGHFGFNSLNIHHATFIDKKNEENNFLLLNEPYFKMNHYSCQSREFWNTVKCARGDGDFWRIRKPEEFDAIDLNDVEDTDLLKQNMPVLEKLGLNDD